MGAQIEPQDPCTGLEVLQKCGKAFWCLLGKPPPVPLCCWLCCSLLSGWHGGLDRMKQWHSWVGGGTVAREVTCEWACTEWKMGPEYGSWARSQPHSQVTWSNSGSGQIWAPSLSVFLGVLGICGGMGETGYEWMIVQVDKYHFGQKLTVQCTFGI